MKYKYPRKTDGPRTTGRGVVLKDGKILLMERWRDGLHYFSVPGGGVEADETLEETAEREIKEETSVEVKVGRLLYEMQDSDGGHRHYIYLCEYISGVPHLPKDSEEASHGPENRFKPDWIPLEQVKDLQFMYWEPIQKLLIEDIDNGFSKKVKITAV